MAQMSIGDKEIIALFSSSDQRAVSEFKNKYGDLCLSIALNILHNMEDAEECTNDVYINLWNGIPPSVENFKAYVCKVTKNLAINKCRYNLAEKRNNDLIISLSDLEESVADPNCQSDSDENELGEKISRFLRAEDTVHRNVFVRRYWFMDSIKDIAEKYSFSESKVKSMLFHTRNKLKKFLKREGVDI